MRLLTTLACPTLLALALATTAEGMMVEELRGGFGVCRLRNYSAQYDYTAGPLSTQPTGKTTVDAYDGDNPTTFAFSYTQGHLHRGGGFIWSVGGEGFTSVRTVSSPVFGDKDYYTQALYVVAKFGYGLPLGRRVHLEFMPFFNLGEYLVEDADVAVGNLLDRETADGSYAAIGMHVGCYVAVTPHFVIGVSGRITRASTSTSVDFRNTGGSYDATADFTLVGGQLELGYRF